MTGFGRAAANISGRQVVAEIKSLNGKGFELNTSKLSSLLRAWELDLRTLIARRIIRGTADVTITIRHDGATKPLNLNLELAAAYYENMRSLAHKLGLGDKAEDGLLASIMRMPEIIYSEAEVLPEEDWKAIVALLNTAIDALIAHRRTEGLALADDLVARMDAIEEGVTKVIPLEDGRMTRVKERLMANLRESGAESKDPNRFEQELIYYMEKMDISEEKTRLAQHCRYFRDVLSNDDTSKGKVLGFILQEIGREINTMGSKANDAGIQQLVVGMKDELEKAKEQVLNVL
jgi:uncharacterized protein (TIGR00255 family)